MGTNHPPPRILERSEHIKCCLEYCYILRSHIWCIEEILLEEIFEVVASHPKALTAPLLLMKQHGGGGAWEMLESVLGEKRIQELVGIEAEELSSKELIKLEDERGKQIE